MISAVTNRGKVSGKVYAGSINAERAFEFIKQLLKYKRHKVYVILDNARRHHRKKVGEFVERNKKKIAV